MVGKQKVVAVCTSRIYDLQVYDYLVSLNEQLKKQGFSLWIYALNEDLYWNEDNNPAEVAIFSYIDYEKTDMILLMDEKIKSHRIAGEIIREARLHNKPVVVVDGKYEGCSDVCFDFRAGYEALVRHVFDCHEVKKPFYIGGFRGNAFSEERKEVLCKVAAEHGVFMDESRVLYGDFWATPARKAAEEIVARGDLPDAIFCANDIMAINVMDVLKSHGVRIPEDVLVTGFDGYDEAFQNTPGLTTVTCELTDLVNMTAQAVLREMEGAQPDSYRVTPALVTNESCGCPRCETWRKNSISSFNNRFYRYQDDVRFTHDCVTKMIMSGTLEEAVSHIEGRSTDRMCCVVKAECFREERNFFTEEPWDSPYLLIFDSIHSGGKRVFDRKEIMPDLEARMEGGYPLIFQGLDYMERPMGYVVYYFEDYNVTDYAKTATLTEMVNQGVGGYINMRYQQYLLSRMKEIYKVDALTGLYNRLAFRESFEVLKNDPEMQGVPMLVFMADLDYLKTINDTYGHKAGDQAIAAVAEALQMYCPDNALCVRFGGDEMLAFIPGGADANTILRNIAQRLEGKSEELGFRISASCGSYLTTICSDMNLQEVVDVADKKMYEVKRKRKK